MVGPSPGQARACSVHHQYSSRDSPFQAKTGTPFGCVDGPVGPDGHGGGGVVLGGEDVAAGPAHLGAQGGQGLDEHGGLDGHVQRAGDPGAPQRLLGAVLGPHGHEAGHLVLGQLDLLAPELGQGEIGHLEVGMMLLAGHEDSFAVAGRRGEPEWLGTGGAGPARSGLGRAVRPVAVLAPISTQRMVAQAAAPAPGAVTIAGEADCPVDRPAGDRGSGGRVSGSECGRPGRGRSDAAWHPATDAPWPPSVLAGGGPAGRLRLVLRRRARDFGDGRRPAGRDLPRAMPAGTPRSRRRSTRPSPATGSWSHRATTTRRPTSPALPTDSGERGHGRGDDHHLGPPPAGHGPVHGDRGRHQGRIVRPCSSSPRAQNYGATGSGGQRRRAQRRS